MSYQVFARKYRPKSFKDVLGQDHVIQTLSNAIAQNRLAHAYLFVGPRGTGKTSTARIFAKALNCPNGPSIDFDPDDTLCVEIAEGRSIDVIEIDGASNNGVEQVRELRDNARFAPSSCRFKIYYIDEVHMLSTSAFNALLKILEEPPPHIKFIFATTEPNKILPTILSRCQRFDLRPIPTQTIADQLTFIAQNEGVQLDPAAAWAVAKGADGGMRDAQSMLDQLVAFCGEHITEANVLDVFGFTSREIVAQLIQNIISKKAGAALDLLNQQAATGKDVTHLLNDTISCLRALLVSKVDKSADSEGIPPQIWERLLSSAADVKTDRLLHLVDLFADAESRMKWANNKKLHFEIAIIKAIQSLDEIRISDVITALAGAGHLDSSELPTEATPPSSPAQATSSTPSPADAPSVNTEQESAPTLESNSSPFPEPVSEVTSELAEETTPETISEPSTSEEITQTVLPTSDADLQFSNAAPAEPTAAAPAASQPEERKPSRQNSLNNAFADLMNAAPDIAPEPIPEPVATAQTTQVSVEKAPEKPKEKADIAQQQADDFHKDPLIQKALQIFEATIKI